MMLFEQAAAAAAAAAVPAGGQAGRNGDEGANSTANGLLCWLDELARRMDCGYYRHSAAFGLSLFPQMGPSYRRVAARGIEATASVFCAPEIPEGLHFVFSVTLQVLDSAAPDALQPAVRGFDSCQLRACKWWLGSAATLGGPPPQEVSGAGPAAGEILMSSWEGLAEIPLRFHHLTWPAAGAADDDPADDWREVRNVLRGKRPLLLGEGGRYRDDAVSRHAGAEGERGCLTPGGTVGGPFTFTAVSDGLPVARMHGRLTLVPGNLRRPTGESVTLALDVECKGPGRDAFVY
jgi:hypothetical protein